MSPFPKEKKSERSTLLLENLLSKNFAKFGEERNTTKIRKALCFFHAEAFREKCLHMFRRLRLIPAIRIA
jgi:hypothetical protein